MACLGVKMEVMTSANVVIIKARCIGGLKETVWNEGSDRLFVDFI